MNEPTPPDGLAEETNVDELRRRIDVPGQLAVMASEEDENIIPVPKDVPLATVKDYENYISRLKQWPRYVREQIAL